MDFGQMLDHLIKTTDVAGLRVDVLATLLKDMGRREGAMQTLNFVTGVLAGAEVKLNGKADSEPKDKPKAVWKRKKRVRKHADLNPGLCDQIAQYLDEKKYSPIDYSRHWSAWGLKVNPQPTDEMMAAAKGLGPDDFAPVRAVLWSLWGYSPHYMVVQKWMYRRDRRLPVARAHRMLMTTRQALLDYVLRDKLMSDAKKSHEALLAK